MEQVLFHFVERLQGINVQQETVGLHQVMVAALCMMLQGFLQQRSFLHGGVLRVVSKFVQQRQADVDVDEGLEYTVCRYLYEV